MTARRVIRVLESFPEPKSTTNPYITQLARALQATPGVQMLTFRPARALFGRYDVFHIHWPENLIGGHRAVGRAARRVFGALFLVRLTLGRTAVVRTWHNGERPAGLGRIDNFLLDRFDKRTRAVIVLNDVLPTPEGKHVTTILHGHYRDWFAETPLEQPVPARLAYVGILRPYKGVEGLLDTFARTVGEDLTLTVMGHPTDPDLAHELSLSAERDQRVTLTLKYANEEAFAAAISASSIVVLPYLRMHNSGSLLAALSLDRPVLVPAGAVTDALAAEVGEDWVLRFSGTLTPADLRDAIEAANERTPGSRPDLSRREWSTAGAAHRDVFAAALDAR